MNAVLSPTERPRLLRAGVQPAIAAGGDEFAAAAEIELISILRSPAFRGSPRSMAFLRFVVEEALAGRRDLLKERTVGAAVLGKAPGYDIGADCGVRVAPMKCARFSRALRFAVSEGGNPHRTSEGELRARFVAVAAQWRPAPPPLPCACGNWQRPACSRRFWR